LRVAILISPSVLKRTGMIHSDLFSNSRLIASVL
jgi:hypothetical protein